MHHCPAAISDICTAEVANNLCLLNNDVNDVNVTVYCSYWHILHTRTVISVRLLAVDIINALLYVTTKVIKPGCLELHNHAIQVSS